MKYDHLKTLGAIGYGITLAIFKGGTIIQSVYLKHGLMPLVASMVGLSLPGIFLPTRDYESVKKSYKITTIVRAIYHTYNNFGSTHTKYIAPKYKKISHGREEFADNKVHKIYLLDSLAHLGYKAADVSLTTLLPEIIADKAASFTSDFIGDNPLELANIISISYGLVIASGDVVINNPLYSNAIKAIGLLLPAVFLPIFAPPIYKDKIFLSCKTTAVIKNTYIIYNALQDLQHPGIDRYKNYPQTKADKFSMFKGILKINDMLTADKLYQLDKMNKISLATMDLVLTNIIMPIFADKTVGIIWNNIDSVFSFGLFAIRGEYSPIVATVYIGSGLLLGFNNVGLTADPAYLFMPLFAFFTPSLNYKQIETTYKIAIRIKAADKIIKAVNHFQQVSVFADKKDFEEVFNDDQYIEGTKLAISAASDLVVKDFLVFAAMNFIGLDNSIVD